MNTALQTKPQNDSNNTAQAVFENLLSSQLANHAGTEVVMSITTVPPHTTCPVHWHPGEEFAYILEGSLTLLQQGKPDEHYSQGDAAMVPFKQVHTIRTGEEAVKVLIFGVHEEGQPGRILVEESLSACD